MFDKLIVSEPEGADFKNRRSYFMVSSIVVGALFLTAVVISIYSADIGLGNDQIELSTMLPPVAMAAEAPEPPKPREPAASSPEQSTVPTRQVNMASVNEPTVVPTTTSTAANPYASRPNEPFQLGPRDTTPFGSGRNETGPESSGPGLAITPGIAENTAIPDPPPVKPPPIQSLGVINGKATYLPPPPYPETARAIRLSG